MTEAQIVLGSGADMAQIGAGEAALILASPPYWPEDLESAVEADGRGGVGGPELARRLCEFPFALRPVYVECDRILAADGTLILQVRDVRIGTGLVGVEGLHRDLLEVLGLQLRARHVWRPRHVTATRRQKLANEAAAGLPHPFDPEVFLVFTRPGGHPRGEPAAGDLDLLQADVIVTQKGHLPAPHPHQAPMPLLEAFIRCYSRAGDLVVDPFAGGGTTVVMAKRLGRRAIGYECNPEAVELARRNIGGAAS